MMNARLMAAALLAVVAVPALAEDVAYQVVNDSSSTLVGFYTSPVFFPVAAAAVSMPAKSRATAGARLLVLGRIET